VTDRRLVPTISMVRTPADDGQETTETPAMGRRGTGTGVTGNHKTEIGTTTRDLLRVGATITTTAMLRLAEGATNMTITMIRLLAGVETSL